VRLLKDTGLAHFTLHDLRRTYATLHAKMGTPVHVSERLLNHVSGTISGVAAVYNRHSYQEEMQVAVTHFGDMIAAMMQAVGDEKVSRALA
jgi:integrase